MKIQLSTFWVIENLIKKSIKLKPQGWDEKEDWRAN